MCLGSEHPFQQGGSWLHFSYGEANPCALPHLFVYIQIVLKFSLQFPRQGVMSAGAPA